MALLPQEVSKLLDTIQADDSIALSDVSTRVRFPIHRQDVGAVIVHTREMPLDAAKNSIRAELRTIGWQCSEMNGRPSLLLLAPMEVVSVKVAFHAT